MIKIKICKDEAIIIETLERLGIGNRQMKTIYPSVYLRQISDGYALFHFKELMALDGLNVNITEEDLNRRNSIIKLLEKWNLIKIVDETFPKEFETVFVYVLSYAEKVEWKISHKYKIGGKII